MEKIHNLIHVLEKISTKKEENFRKIEYILTNLDDLLNFDIFRNLNKGIKNNRFNITLKLKEKRTDVDCSIIIEEDLQIKGRNIDNFNEKFDSLKSLIETFGESIVQNEFELLKKGFNNCLFNDYDIREITILIDKRAIEKYLIDKFSLPENIEIVYWYFLDYLTEFLKEKSLKILYNSLIKSNKIVVFVIPQKSNRKLFSNFFEIVTLDYLSELKDCEDYYNKKIVKIKSLLRDLRKETDCEDEVPIFPIFNEFVKNTELNEVIYNSLARIYLFYIFLILSYKIEKMKNTGDFYIFKFGHNQKQTLLIKSSTDHDSLIISEYKKKSRQFNLAIKEIFQFYNEMLSIDFFSYIGHQIEKKIRETSILRIIQPKFKNMCEFITNYNDIEYSYNKVRRDLISSRIKDLNESYKQSDLLIRNCNQQISSSTTKLTEEISKSLLTLIGAASITIFSWYVKFVKEDFPIPNWFYEKLTPAIGLIFTIFFIMQLVSIYNHVQTQILYYKELSADMKKEIGLRINESIEKRLNTNRIVFYIYFGLIISAAISLLGFIISILCIFNK